MYDKSTVLIILGSLIKKPNLFLDEKYNINEQDFVERFHTIIFGAIKNLYLNGVQTITALEIDTYLSNYAVQKKIFDDNNGIQYVDNLIKFAKIENFDFHYNILKKYTLLRKLKAEGIDTSCFIDENIVDPKKTEEMMAKFNELTVNDILNTVERKIVSVKDEFYKSNDEQEQHIFNGLEQLINSYKISPEMGLPMNSNIFNTVCRGMRQKKLYLGSSPSGCFKSRTLLGNCAKISIPYYYDIEKREWKYTGFNEPTLFITTELEIDEIQTMLIAYITGINETTILDGNYLIGQDEIVKQAIEYIKKSNMYIVHLPNYSVEDIERTVKKYHLLYNINYVFFDYIFTTPKMLGEMSKVAKGIKIREDVALLNLITSLKDMCNNLDVFLYTYTQVSDGWQNSKYPDSSLIRACKSLSDKCDISYIGLPPSKEDLELLQPILSKGLYPVPNLCYHIYKVRRGSYNKIRLYMYFDGGTCRTTELFATNNNCELIEITGTNIEKVLDETTTQINGNEEEIIQDEIEETSIENSSEELLF